MSNCITFAEHFFDTLVMAEDAEHGHSYKSYIRIAVREFLQNENQETAYAVYRAFFDSYRIRMEGTTNPFVDLVDILRNYEATAATLIDKQRDHFIHSVNVFICGLSVYAESPRFRNAFASAVPEDGYLFASRHPNEEFFYRWGIASLFHDVGYPVEIVGHQINRFVRMVADADGQEVSVKAQIRYENFSELDHIQEVIPKRRFTKSYYDAYESCSYIDLLSPLDLLAHRIHLSLGTRLGETKAYLDRFTDSMAESGFIDHGFYSALIVMKWYGFLIQQSELPPEKFFWSVTDSATAILLHNYYRNVLQKPPFSLGAMRPEQNPIAYLLILCDELQEWNREAHGILTRTYVQAETVNLSLQDGYLAATYITRAGTLPESFCAEKKSLLRTLLDIDAVFPQGLDVDTVSLNALSALRPEITPEAAPRPLLENVELLAVAIHARYNEKQLSDHPERALAYPNFSELPDDIKYSNLRQAQGIYEKLRRFGYTLCPKGTAGAITAFSPELIEIMAEQEHEEWMAERISRGWTLGEKNVEKKTSPYLIPYAELSDEIKDYDRDTIRNIPLLAERVGMAVCAL